MSLLLRNSYTLLLLCAALAPPSTVATGDTLDESTGARPSVQELDPGTSARKPFVPGFSPYPVFIDGHSPRRSVDEPQQLAVQCSSENQCSNTATAGDPAQVLASQSAPALPDPHTAAQPTTEHHLQEPSAQPADKQEQQLPDNAQHFADQHASAPVESTQSAQAPPAAAAGQETPHAVPSQEPTAAEAPVTPGDLESTAPPPPVRRLLNLALLSDGASVLAANPEAKRPERAIDRDIDSFMKNDCSAEKWMVIELSQLGTVETVKLTMKELYSSRVHTFRVLGRSSHPRKDGPDLTASIKSDAWQLLGRFTAENKRGTQSFSLPQRSRVRYILLMFDTHYGSEAMCAMNMIEVLGVSAAQELEEALAMQEELEAEELFQHLQQQQEQEEQMQAQQQQHKQQPQRQSAVAVGGGEKAQTGTPRNESAAAQEEQQPVSLALQQHPQQQQDSQLPPLVGSAQLQDLQQQQVVQQTAAGVDMSSSSSGDVMVIGQVDRTTQSVGKADTQGATSGSSRGGAITEHPKQLQLLAGIPVGTDQDVIAVPTADTTTQQHAGSASDTDKSLMDGSVVPQQLIPAVDRTAIAWPAATGGTSPAIVDGPAVISTPDQRLQEQSVAQEVEQQPPAWQASPAPAAGPQVGAQQPVIGAPQAAEQPGSMALSAGAAAAGSAAAGALADAAVNGRTSATAGAEVPVPVGVASGLGATAAIAAPAVASKQSEGPAAIAVQQKPAVQQQQTSPQHQQQQALSSTGALSQQAHQRSQPPAREPALAGGTAKPKQAGNLFDIIKSEMMQLKLEQGKVSKKLDGLGRRGSEYEQLAAQLQVQQGQLLAQLEALSSKVGQLAEQVARVDVVQQYNTHHHHHHHTTKGPADSSHSPGDGRPHPHAAHGRHNVQVSQSTMHLGPRHILVCDSGVVAVPLLLHPRYQWLVVGLLAASAGLGLLVLFWHPSGSKLSSGLRFGIGGLVMVNVVLALLLGVYLLVLEGLFRVSHQQAYAHQHRVLYNTVFSVPEHRMIGNGSV